MYFLIGGWSLHHDLLVSAVHQCESATGTHVSLPLAPGWLFCVLVCTSAGTLWVSAPEGLPLHLFLKVYYVQDFQYFKIWIVDIKDLLLFWFYIVCIIVSLRLFKDERMDSSLLLLDSFIPFTYYCLLVYLFLLGKLELLHFMFIISVSICWAYWIYWRKFIYFFFITFFSITCWDSGLLSSLPSLLPWLPCLACVVVIGFDVMLSLIKSENWKRGSNRNLMNFS